VNAECSFSGVTRIHDPITTEREAHRCQQPLAEPMKEPAKLQIKRLYFIDYQAEIPAGHLRCAA
jgi:hypothetical protein